jgi:tetrahydromethanopterin S-methyltransferase subunit C
MIFATKVKNNTCSVDWCNFLATQCCGVRVGKNGERKVEQSVGVGLGTGFQSVGALGLGLPLARRCFWVPNKEASYAFRPFRPKYLCNSF